MNTMKYKGYSAKIDFDDRDNILVGRLVGVADDVSFHAETVSDLRKEFEIAVDDYLEYCEKSGKSPTRAVSGKLALRLPPDLHHAATVTAKSAGQSLNAWIVELVKHAAHG